MSLFSNILNFFIPNRLTFGADIKNIFFQGTTVVKEFKTAESFRNTIEFYRYTPGYTHLFPKLYGQQADHRLILTENCGDLVNLYTLPPDWEQQLNTLRDFFVRKEFLILDIRFMPHTPYVINNLCVKEGKIYLVDLAMHAARNQAYINNHFDLLIAKIKVYQYLRGLPFLLYPVHIIYYVRWLLTDLWEKLV